MDILKRAYLKTIDEWPKNAEILGFHKAVRDEVIRLIEVRAYGKQEWPHQLGPLPDELRSKSKKEVGDDNR